MSRLLIKPLVEALKLVLVKEPATKIWDRANVAGCLSSFSHSIDMFLHQSDLINLYMVSIIFETERLIVRPYTESDKENFFLLNSNADVMRFIRPVKTKEECDAFLVQVIAAATAMPLFGRWAVIAKPSGEFVGSFAVIPVENTDHMQMGYALLPQHWGKGYATELTQGGLNYVFCKTPLDLVYGYTEKPNVASQKVLLKCGFKCIGSLTEGNTELTGFVYEKKDYTMISPGSTVQSCH